jgi:hypothetical protein
MLVPAPLVTGMGKRIKYVWSGLGELPQRRTERLWFTEGLKQWWDAPKIGYIL